MKSIKGASVVLAVILTFSTLASEKSEKPREELEAVKTELKPLRLRAGLDPDVIIARKKLDAAYRAYWESVRVAMVRLDPGKKKLIEKEIALRKQLSAVRGESKPNPQKKPKATTN